MQKLVVGVLEGPGDAGLALVGLQMQVLILDCCSHLPAPSLAIQPLYVITGLQTTMSQMPMIMAIKKMHSTVPLWQNCTL